MRHDQLNRTDTFDTIDVAAIWPRPDGGTQLPVGELQPGLDTRPAPAVPDMPGAVGAMIAGVYALIFAIFFVTMATSAFATFMIVISGLYVVIFFAVPRVFLAVENDPSRRPTMSELNARGMDTFTGHVSGPAALAQIFAVPVLLCIPLLVMGITALAVLP